MAAGMACAWTGVGSGIAGIGERFQDGWVQADFFKSHQFFRKMVARVIPQCGRHGRSKCSANLRNCLKTQRSRFRHESFVPVRRSAHVYLGGARGRGLCRCSSSVRDARFVIAIAAMHKARILRSDARMSSIKSLGNQSRLIPTD